MKTLIMLLALIGAVLVAVILTRCVRKQKRSPLFAGLAMASYVAISAFTIGLMEAFGTLDVKFSRLAELFAKWFAGFGERSLLVTGIAVFLLCGACVSISLVLSFEDHSKIAEPLLYASIFAASCDASFLILAKAGFGTVGRVSSLVTLISDMNAVKQTIAWIVCLSCSMLCFVLASSGYDVDCEKESGRNRGNGRTIKVYDTHDSIPVNSGKVMTFRVERYSKDGWRPAVGISYKIAGCPLDDGLPQSLIARASSRSYVALRKTIVDHPVYKEGETDKNGEIEFISSKGGEAPVIIFPEDKVYANAEKGTLRIVIVSEKTDSAYGVICGYGHPKASFLSSRKCNRAYASLALSCAEIIVMGNYHSDSRVYQYDSAILNFKEALENRAIATAILLGCLALTAAIVLISATGIEFSRIL